MTFKNTDTSKERLLLKGFVVFTSEFSEDRSIDYSLELFYFDEKILSPTLSVIFTYSIFGKQPSFFLSKETWICIRFGR